MRKTNAFSSTCITLFVKPVLNTHILREHYYIVCIYYICVPILIIIVYVDGDDDNDDYDDFRGSLCGPEFG